MKVEDIINSSMLAIQLYLDKPLIIIDTNLKIMYNITKANLNLKKKDIIDKAIKFISNMQKQSKKQNEY